MHKRGKTPVSRVNGRSSKEQRKKKSELGLSRIKHGKQRGKKGKAVGREAAKKKREQGGSKSGVKDGKERWFAPLETA